MLAAAGTVLAVGAAGCSSLNDANASDSKPVTGASSHGAGSSSKQDSGCTKALEAISRHGPSAVKLMSQGRQSISKATARVLVDGLDLAADAAGSPQSKQTIQRLADDYVDFFRLTDEAETITLSALLKDATALDFICR